MLAYYTNELYHHGILGQKWGVRRFQRADGTLTPAGKHRYEPEDLSSLSDEEMQRKLNRVRNELAYHKAMSDIDRVTGVTGNGEKAVKMALGTLATAVTVTGSIITLRNNGRQITNMILGR